MDSSDDYLRSSKDSGHLMDKRNYSKEKDKNLVNKKIILHTMGKNVNLPALIKKKTQY